MSDETPNVLDMELSPETANYRKSRLMLWQTILASYTDYVADGMKVVQADNTFKVGIPNMGWVGRGRGCLRSGGRGHHGRTVGGLGGERGG